MGDREPMKGSTDGTDDGWPPAFPIDEHGRVTEGLVVRSISGEIEGRTTGARRPCASASCTGWFITVSWETGQIMHICSEGWIHDPGRNEVRVVAGGEISARYISPAPAGTPPLPRDAWPDPSSLKGRGWEVNPKSLD